jgi:uncharacterized protein (TIGR02246 family)
MARLALFLALLLLTAGPVSAADLKADEARIRALIGEWLEAVAAKDADRTAGFYAADGMMMPQGAPAAIGTGAIAKAWGGLYAMKDFSLIFTPSSITVAEAGDMAMDIGTYELSFTGEDGKKVADHGKYVVVWKKVDGDWKAAADIFNSDGGM